MSRSHVAVLGRWLQALGVATAYLAVAAGLFWLDLGDAGEAPAWAVVVVPLVYAALSLVLLRRASPARHLKWTGGACLMHVALGAAAAAAFTMVVDVTALSALGHALARLGPVPLLTFVATPMALAPFRGRVLSVRTTPRAERARAATPAAPVVPASAAAVAPTTAVAPTAATPFATSSETPTLRDPRPRKLIADSAEPAASSAAAKSPEPVDDIAGDDVVRVRFERIAGQLPARAFTLPLDRVAESLREPHWITARRTGRSHHPRPGARIRDVGRRVSAEVPRPQADAAARRRASAAAARHVLDGADAERDRRPRSVSAAVSAARSAA